MILPFAEQVDEAVDAAVCDLLHWSYPQQDDISDDAQEVRLALDQLRLPISKGGWGLRRMSQCAPAAIASSLFSLLQWLERHPELFQAIVFESTVDERGFFRSSYAKVLPELSKYNIPVCQSPPEVARSDDQQGPRFVGIPAADSSWLTNADCLELLPTRRQIFGHIQNASYDKLGELLRSLDPARFDRFQAVGQQTIKVTQARPVPLTQPTLGRAQSGSSTEYHHSPMSLMALSSSLELRNETFMVTTAQQCGVKLAVDVLPAGVRDTLSSDPYGDDILNMNFARHFSHDAVVSGITRELCSLGVTASCQPRLIPRCPALSQQDLHGDIVILSSGLNSDGATSSALKQVILDVAVVHNATRQGECRTFKKSCISNTESYKKQKYRDYAPRNEFIPLVADSVGRIGGHAL